VTAGQGPIPVPIPSLVQKARDLYDVYLEDLRSLVDIDCGTFLPDGVNQVADYMHKRFEEGGWSVERRSHAPPPGGQQLGDVVVARMAGESRGPRILLVGHMDTVFPEGTAVARPFRIEGTRALGPGVSDMKGGLLAGLYAVSCLRGGDFGSVTYVCNPDEEIGSPFSGPTILEFAQQADACLVLEGARENGDIVSARKGVTDLQFLIHGRAAHAGVEPERGRSATLQAAHTTIALHALNGRWRGVTVNVGLMQGGIRPNVVAERCELRVDIRAPTSATLREAMAEVERIGRSTVVPDTTIELTATAGFPPMEKTEATERLVRLAKEIAAEIGFEVEDAATGGASDANPVANMGVPTLDGLGPIGGADHSPSEWLDLDSVVPRMALLAGLMVSAPHGDSKE
jgi:glutamate carboxypeptidase